MTYTVKRNGRIYFHTEHEKCRPDATQEAQMQESGHDIYSFILPFASSVRVELGAYTFGGFVEVDPDTVGQYTGMVDKNGKKIFEGDIVLKRTYNVKRTFPVTFTGGMFHAGYGGGSSTATHPYTLDDRQIEVIGNRWDNQELLEVKK